MFSVKRLGVFLGHISRVIPKISALRKLTLDGVSHDKYFSKFGYKGEYSCTHYRYMVLRQDFFKLKATGQKTVLFPQWSSICWQSNEIFGLFFLAFSKLEGADAECATKRPPGSFNGTEILLYFF